MLEFLGLGEWSPKSASVLFGLLIGAAFGALAQRSRFCLRRALVSNGPDQRQALGLWFTAFGIAIVGTALLVGTGYIDFSEHRYHSSTLALPAIMLGGLMFGVGMVLARGCASRLTVLTGNGNLRALAVVLVFAVTAHATLKGVLAPLRVWISSFAVELPFAGALTSLPGGLWIGSGLLAATAIIVVFNSKVRARELAMGAALGALVPLSWFITTVVLADDFDPIAQESVAFTASASQTLFWWIAGTAVAPDFGVGMFGGTLVGSFIAAVAAREFAVTGFTSDVPTGRYLTGGVLMGVGGVLAGGCTVGAGLSGVSTLSLSAVIALVSIMGGALLATRLSRRVSQPSGTAVPAAMDADTGSLAVSSR